MNYPERTEEEERERREAEDRKGEHEMEYEREMKMNEDWKLTDGEIADALNTEAKVPCPGHDTWTVDDITHLDRAIAIAAQRKLVEWMRKNNINSNDFFAQTLAHPALKYIDVQMSKGDLWLDGGDFDALLSALSPHQEAGK